MSHSAAAVANDEEHHHHHKSTLDRLIYMANQIGWFFESQPEHKVVPGIFDHILHFWDPRMRTEIFRHIEETGGEGLDAPVIEALNQLKLATDARKKAAATG